MGDLNISNTWNNRLYSHLQSPKNRLITSVYNYVLLIGCERRSGIESSWAERVDFWEVNKKSGQIWLANSAVMSGINSNDKYSLLAGPCSFVSVIWESIKTWENISFIAHSPFAKDSSYDFLEKKISSIIRRSREKTVDIVLCWSNFDIGHETLWKFIYEITGIIPWIVKAPKYYDWINIYEFTSIILNTKKWILELYDPDNDADHVLYIKQYYSIFL